jgi:histidine triad (HIT) family protein
MDSIFTKILNREIPAEFVFENDHVFAIRDISPQAPVHVIIITKSEIAGLSTLPNDGDHLAILNAAKEIAMQEGLGNGYRLVINQGEDGGQSVNHLHAHLLGGRKLCWPPG